jgi:hypothetical protein
LRAWTLASHSHAHTTLCGGATPFTRAATPCAAAGRPVCDSPVSLRPSAPRARHRPQLCGQGLRQGRHRAECGGARQGPEGDRDQDALRHHYLLQGLTRRPPRVTRAGRCGGGGGPARARSASAALAPPAAPRRGRGRGRGRAGGRAGGVVGLARARSVRTLHGAPLRLRRCLSCRARQGRGRLRKRSGPPREF